MDGGGKKKSVRRGAAMVGHLAAVPQRGAGFFFFEINAFDERPRDEELMIVTPAWQHHLFSLNYE